MIDTGHSHAPDAGRALYLRWRPRRFDEVVGQPHVIRTLKNAARSGTFGHAYLLTGPRGTGKTSLARIFFRAINCLDPRDGEPCNTCEVCTAALRGTALDLVEMDAASNRRLEDLRQSGLLEKVAYAPTSVRYRVYILDEAHEFTDAVWDAFLKTIEEPPPHAVFVLCTTEAHKVPATIVSRCQRFDLRRIGVGEIVARLEEIARSEGLQVDPEVLQRLSRLARGGLRDAVSLLDQVSAYAGAARMDTRLALEALGLPSLESVLRLLVLLEEADGAAAVVALSETVQAGADLRQVVGELLGYLRGLLLVRAGAEAALAGDFPIDEAGWLREHAGRWESSVLAETIRRVSEMLAQDRDPLRLRLHLELLALERVRSTPPRLAPPESPGRSQVSAATQKPPDERGSAIRAQTGLAEVGGAVHPIPPTTAQDGPPLVQAAANGSAGGTSAPVLSAASPETPETIPVPSVDPGSGERATIPTGDLRLVEERWGELVQRVNELDATLGAALLTARPMRLEQGELTLGFSFKFHREWVNDPASRRQVEDVFSAALGSLVRVRCIAAASTQMQLAPSLEAVLQDPYIQEAVRLFGGETFELE